MAVYAIHYGSFDYPSDMVFTLPHPQERVEMGLFAFLIEDESGYTLIDTGFDDPTLCQRWQVRNFCPVPRVLASSGISPARIVISHGHWDHCGCLSSFPEQEVWIAEAELLAMEMALDGRSEGAGYLRRDLDALRQRSALQIVKTPGGPITPSLRATVVGGHTPGSLALKHHSGLVLASDNACFFANLEPDNPLPKAGRSGADALPTIRQLGSELIPGHDPALTRRYPQVAPCLYKLR